MNKIIQSSMMVTACSENELYHQRSARDSPCHVLWDFLYKEVKKLVSLTSA